MPKRNRYRAARRVAERTKRNALALAAAAETAAEPPKRRNARFKRVLEILRNRSTITLQQFQAGDRLYRDYLASGSQLGQLTMRWEPPTFRSSSARDTAGCVAARERFEAAMRDAGRGLALVLMHCVICDESPTSWAGLNGKAETDGVPVLRVALDVLLEFYCGTAPATGGLMLPAERR